MAWVEGVTSSNRILRDLVNIMVNANKDIDGETVPEQNWELVYPRPFNTTDVVGEALTVQTDTKIYKAAKADWFPQKAPVVYQTVASVTEVVLTSEYTVDYETGTITFVKTPTGTITCDYAYVTDRDLATGLAKIQPYGKIVLKTKTTPVTPDASADPFNTDPDLRVAALSMYLEIEKPQYLINPETGQEAVKYGTVHKIENHYHINARIFDHYDYVTEKPKGKVVNESTGIVIDEGAHVSNWSKLSWYKDFKEFLVDELDGDPGTDNVSDGIVFAFIETPGIYGELPIQYWLSVTNDRLAMVLMGEPSINYDNYLTSFAYVGKVASFEGGVNDTAGNFALTTGSSTIPCVANPNLDPIVELPQFTFKVLSNDFTSTNYGKSVAGVSPKNQAQTHTISYKVVAVNEHGRALATEERQATYIWKYNSSSGASEMPEDTRANNFALTFTKIPANATHVQLYRKDVITQVSSMNKTTTNWLFEKELTREVALAGDYTPDLFLTDTTKPVPVSNYDASKAGVVRDQLTGAVIEVKFPSQWGVNTATGVTDVSMYKARSGDGTYFQRHQTSFITPEEFMQKDAFNPSRWTNKFHLSPLYIVHGYDGYRGWLDGVVAVDDSSIVHLDELIVNKGQANEEIYKYFKVTAPFSLMQNSANTNYGIGIKKV